MYSSIWYYCFDLCHFLPIHTLPTRRSSVLHMFCVCVQVVVRFARGQNNAYYPALGVCQCICCEFVQTLSIVPRVCASRRESVYWFLLSLSLTKLSMENKCGSYILQNINKNSQVVPKIFCFSVFLVLLPLVCKCVCVWCVFGFKICFASDAFELLAELTKY